MPVKSVSIRIEKEMLRKLSFVVDCEGRALNSHVLAMIRQNIRELERMHGPAETAITPDTNVKPGKK